MAYPTFREIMIRYANENGGGLPLTPEEICNAAVLWVQDAFNELSNKITGDVPILVKSEVDNWLVSEAPNSIKTAVLYDNLIEGSETIVVDVNEDNTALEIHLDADIVQKIDRSVKTPLQTPVEPKLPVLGVDNAIVWEPISSVGGGTKLYIHNILQRVPVEEGPTHRTIAVSTRAYPYSSMDEVVSDFINGSCLRIMVGDNKIPVAFFQNNDCYVFTPQGFSMYASILMKLATDNLMEL